MTDYRSRRRELARMMARRDETRQLIAIINDSLRRKAERSTLAERPKARAYGRHATTWTPADERHYLAVLDRLHERNRPELARLEGRLERQDAAIAALRARLGVNEPDSAAP
ncbi:MAG: hypothetical protein M9939_26010 [Mesorhizobium sp.]|nr:hypothetical protein [Mesorhizobium sp.]MCO5164551.1 hypothetical protein [Mesorhizobium sp.]